MGILKLVLDLRVFISIKEPCVAANLGLEFFRSQIFFFNLRDTVSIQLNVKAIFSDKGSRRNRTLNNPVTTQEGRKLACPTKNTHTLLKMVSIKVACSVSFPIYTNVMWEKYGECLVHR